MLGNFFRQPTHPMRYGELESKYHVDSSDKRLLGSGSYGHVYKGVDKITGKEVAIKKIKDFSKSPDDLKPLLREVSLLRMLGGHPNIISLEYIGTAVTNGVIDEIDLVFDRYQFDLGKIIHSRNEVNTPYFVYQMQHIQYFIYQILCGIYSVHAAGLVHRDLKPANILINLDSKIAICDFGLARATRDATGQPYRQLTEYVVTRWYRSPELLLHCRGAGTAPTDMWSIGCIFAELLSRQPFFPGKSESGMMDLIFSFIGTPEQNEYDWIDKPIFRDYVIHAPKKPRQNFQEKFPGADASALDLLSKLLEFNPNKRITAEQALQHPFLARFYNRKDVLTVPLKSESTADKRSSNNYFQFETELEAVNGYLSPEMTTRTGELIVEEIGRYREELCPAPDSDSLSVSVTPSSTTSPFPYYRDNRNDELPNAENERISSPKI